MSKYTYNSVIKKYVEARNAIDKIEAEAEAAKQIHRERMAACENWINAQAAKDGLSNIPTEHGTAYWSTHAKCSVVSRDLFLDYVRKMNRWDLLETRASKPAVQSLVEATGLPPAGVNFSTYRKLIVRAKD